MGDTLAEELVGTHFKYYNDDSNKEYGPKNAYLHDSLLSGLLLKFQLTALTNLYAAIVAGLEGKIRSIIFAGPYRRSLKRVVEGLKAQKKRGVVNNPHAIQVLDEMQFISCSWKLG